MVQHADEVLRPFRAVADHLTTMPGVSDTVARVLIAEIGVDMSRFPTPGHLVSWGRALPAVGRECGQAPVDPDPARDAVAEDGADPGRVGGDPEARQLSAGPVPAAPRPAWPEEGDRGGRRLHADGGLLHAPRRGGLPRPRGPVPGQPRCTPCHPAAPASAA